MTKFCLDRENTNAWFTMDGGGSIHYQLINSDDWAEIRKKTTEKKVEYIRVEGKAERFEYEETNTDLQNEFFWDKTILEWKDLYRSDGTIIECTKENKMLLVKKSSYFVNFSNKAVETLKDEDERRVEESEKNL